MNISQPIRDMTDLNNLKNYYKKVHPIPRNELLIIVGLNTALRISDLLSLQWKDVFDFSRETYWKHITLAEQKTGKLSRIFINDNIKDALGRYREWIGGREEQIFPEKYLFCHEKENISISRVQAFRIVKQAAQACEIPGVISCHSLRKTFGYHAWKQGVSPVLLMNIYNHSSFQNTRRYLGIEQDDRDHIFQEIHL